MFPRDSDKEASGVIIYFSMSVLETLYFETNPGRLVVVTSSQNRKTFTKVVETIIDKEIDGRQKQTLRP